MVNFAHLFETFSREILKPKYPFFIFLVTLIYMAIGLYSINYKLIFSNFFIKSSLVFKINLLSSLFFGIFTALSSLSFVLLLTAGILTGINLALIFASVNRLKTNGKVKFVVGGGGILGIISTGCATCGFFVLSVLGFGTALSFLPLGSHTLYIFSIAILLFSGVYMLKKLHDTKDCKVNN